MKHSLCFLLLLATLPLSCPLALSSPLKSDEEVILFSSYGIRQDHQAWQVRLHAWVFEPETTHFFTRQLVKQLARILGISPQSPEHIRFQRRVRLFLVDNERNKFFSIETPRQIFQLGPSKANGHILQVLFLPIQSPEWVTFRLTERPHTTTRIELISPVGVSVISDIDDTIKVSQVTDKQALMRNTFLNAAQAVPGMAQVYQQWQQRGVSFHYLSASPWPLYTVLQNFLQHHGFPEGSIQLRDFRFKDRSLMALFKSSRQYKQAHIEQILLDFPGRTFILVGDSGEVDPEIYADIALRYPHQIQQIYIRNVTHQPLLYYQAIFAGLPNTRWHVFTNPASLSLLVTLSNN